MGNFFGTYERALDTKNRLLLPSKLMGQMPLRLYLLRGFEGAISLYEEDAFESYVDKLKGFSSFDQNARVFLRLALGSVVPLELDKQGRITLPTEIKNRYKIGNEVVILGLLDHLEIFDKEAYAEYLSKEEGRFEEIAALLEGGNSHE